PTPPSPRARATSVSPFALRARSTAITPLASRRSSAGSLMRFPTMRSPPPLLLLPAGTTRPPPHPRTRAQRRRVSPHAPHPPTPRHRAPRPAQALRRNRARPALRVDRRPVCAQPRQVHILNAVGCPAPPPESLARR